MAIGTMSALMSGLLIVTLAIIFLGQCPAHGQSTSGVSQRCLDCMCASSSGCDESRGCHTASNGGYFCGPYQISWAYWADGGRLGDRGGPQDFESCLNNKLCAEATIVGYMKKWAADCNGDGRVDCADYAAIHVTGGDNCKADWLERSSYWKAFRRTGCYGPPRAQGRPPQNERPRVDDSSFAERPPSRPRTRPPQVERQPPQPWPRPQPSGGGRGEADRVSWTFSNSTGGPRLPGRRSPEPGTTLSVFPAGNSGNFGPSTAPNGPVNRPRPQPNSPRRPDRPDRPDPQPDISLPPALPRPQPVGNSALPRAQPAGNSAVSGPVTRECLACLCAASSGCDLTKQCVGDFCGPYLISWQYWSDGGSPGGTYVTCALDADCAAAAIQGYMSKWRRDCNGDGVVDCDDFAAIHKLGPHMCREESVSNTDYWRAYEQCPATSVASSSGSGLIQPRTLSTSESARPSHLTTSGLSHPEAFDPRSGPRPDPSRRDILPFNVPLTGANHNGLRDNTISLPRPTKPPQSHRPDNPFFNPSVVTPRPDLPLVTPRRTQAGQRGASFRRARFYGTTERPPVDIGGECMTCMCEASSNCNLEAKCSAGVSGTQACGPFQLDRNYWTVAGSPGYRGAALDFERCAGDKDCSEEAVRRFVSKMAFDCNEDGNVDCLDYAAIHKAGPKACNSQWLLDTPFWSEFQQCYGFGR